jgi:hypothetical protein
MLTLGCMRQVCPVGARAGSRIDVNVNGKVVAMVVPPGVGPGDSFRVNADDNHSVEMAYYRSKVNKTEMLDEMELTDHMNLLKHNLAGKQVSYANFIADQRDSSGRWKVGKATVFVSHVWKMRANDFFEVCVAEMDEDDYAWIDLYLHNQYQGAVSDIGDENSMYWINKFGHLIGSIGKVIAIVTDWAAPTMLKRIWCLFELNAAIESGAELRFVAAGKERLDFTLNLYSRFEGLRRAVSSIEVRDCDATRPHEKQDKKIFLSKLAGLEDDVNEKLRKRMLQWLCEASEGVLERTDPHRPALDEAAMRLEVAALGDCWFRKVRWSLHPSGIFFFFFTLQEGGAKLTRLLETLPRLGPLLMSLGLCINAAALLPLAVWWNGKAASWLWLILVYGIFCIGAQCHTLGTSFVEHQAKRLLRQPALLPQCMVRNSGTLSGILIPLMLIVIPGYELGINVDDEGNATPIGWHNAVLASFAGLLVAVDVLFVPMRGNTSAACMRASLRTKAAWLRLWLNDHDAAVVRLGEAQAELLRMVGPRDVLNSWVVAGAYARALCEAGRAGEATAVEDYCFGCRRRPVGVLALLERAENNATASPTLRAVSRIKWHTYGALLRAGVVAGMRGPDTHVLSLLEQSARDWTEQQYGQDRTHPGCWVPAGSRPVGQVEGDHIMEGDKNAITEGFLPVRKRSFFSILSQ